MGEGRKFERVRPFEGESVEFGDETGFSFPNPGGGINVVGTVRSGWRKRAESAQMVCIFTAQATKVNG